MMSLFNAFCVALVVSTNKIVNYTFLSKNTTIKIWSWASTTKAGLQRSFDPGCVNTIILGGSKIQNDVNFHIKDVNSYNYEPCRNAMFM